MSPMAPARPCSQPFCPHLITNTQPCPIHGKRPWDHGSASPAERGYGAEWGLKRAQVLAEEPVCRYCRKAPSTQVDHVTPKSKGGTDDRSNLAGTCKRCHETKSAREGQQASRR